MDILKPHIKDLGAFTVKRVLPALAHRSVGPFVFFDHFGPVVMPAGSGMDVRPHPHIGLATVTYLFEGSGLHRDSLGSVQEIRPGDVNWMVAGRGIVHSERTPLEDLKRARNLHGIQIWVALPKEEEQCAPAFSHHAAATLPIVELPGVRLRIILGEAFGARSPTPVYSKLFYVHAEMKAGSSLVLPASYGQRAIYAVANSIEVDSTRLDANEMAVATGDDDLTVHCVEDAGVLVLGGEPLDGLRHLNWNFVASTHELIEAARASWKSYPNAQFPEVPNDPEWIPLPG